MAGAKILFILSDPLIRVQKPHQMWKLVDASSQKCLINQAENWDTKDNWEFKENGTFISIQNISKNQVIPIVLTIDADSDKIKEAEFIENFPPQQWIKGDPNSSGFFTLTHLSTKKVLTTSSPEELTISGMYLQTSRSINLRFEIMIFTSIGLLRLSKLLRIGCILFSFLLYGSPQIKASC